MDIFFVLSGYLVSGLLFDETKRRGQARIGRFLIRRGFKIYPAFYAMLAGTCVVRTILGGGLLPRALLAEALFVQNYSPTSLWNHTWSLDVEEHFYLLLALLFAVAQLRKRAFSPLPWALAAFVLCPVFRFFSAEQIPFRTHERLDALAFGVVLRWALDNQALRGLAKRPRVRWVLAVGGLLFMLPAMLLGQLDRFVSVAGLTLLYLGAGGLVLALVAHPWPERNPLARALARVGVDSYSIYLWHMPVIVWLPRLLERAHLHLRAEPVILISIAASLIAGVALARLIELPGLALRERLFPAPHPAIPSALGGGAVAAVER